MRNLDMPSSFLHRGVEVVRWALYLLGLLACIGALAIWVFQWYIWTTKDTWQPLPGSRYISFNETGWIYLDQTMALLLDVNVGYPVCVAGVVLMALSLIRA